MSTGIEKLRQDIVILERFAAEMGAYLRSDMLFWPTGPNVPELTLGGMLLRQQRLLLLRGLLDSAENNRVDHAVAQCQMVLGDQIVRAEARAHQELGARFRQWREYVRDLKADDGASNYYRTAVEPRVMLSLLVEQLELTPYRLDSDIPYRVEAIDSGLRARWRPGDFVWYPEWQPAYSAERYWYLYGQPR